VIRLSQRLLSKQHTTNNSQTAMTSAGFEPTIPETNFLQTHNLDGTTSGPPTAILSDTGASRKVSADRSHSLNSFNNATGQALCNLSTEYNKANLIKTIQQMSYLQIMTYQLIQSYPTPHPFFDIFIHKCSSWDVPYKLCGPTVCCDWSALGCKKMASTGKVTSRWFFLSAQITSNLRPSMRRTWRFYC